MTDLTKAGLKSGETKERRRPQRFLIRGEAWFEWQSVGGTLRQGTGVTRNVGRCGAFVETATVPPIASQLKVVVTLVGGPTDEIEARLCGTGEVRHIQREGGVAGGFGACVIFHTQAPEETS